MYGRGVVCEARQEQERPSVAQASLSEGQRSAVAPIAVLALQHGLYRITVGFLDQRLCGAHRRTVHRFIGEVECPRRSWAAANDSTRATLARRALRAVIYIQFRKDGLHVPQVVWEIGSLRLLVFDRSLLDEGSYMAE